MALKMTIGGTMVLIGIVLICAGAWQYYQARMNSWTYCSQRDDRAIWQSTVKIWPLKPWE